MLGAVTTVLMVAFPTFAQQAITTRTRNVVVPGVSTIARANNFTYDSADHYQEITRGVLDAFSRDNINPAEVEGTCSGQKCIWENYESLAICATTYPMVVNMSAICTNNGAETCSIENSPNATYAGDVLASLPSAFDTNVQWLNVETSFNTTGTSGQSQQDSRDIFLTAIDADKRDTLGYFPMNATKVVIELCTHTYRTVVEGSNTTTTLLHKNPAVTKDSDWTIVDRFPPNTDYAEHLCGKVRNITVCMGAPHVLTAPEDSSFILQFLIGTSGIAGRDTDSGSVVSSIMSDYFQGERGHELVAARMQNLAMSMTNAYVAPSCSAACAEVSLIH